MLLGISTGLVITAAKPLATLSVQVHFLCVNSSKFRELKLTWDNAQHSAKLRYCEVCYVLLGLKAN